MRTKRGIAAVAALLTSSVLAGGCAAGTLRPPHERPLGPPPRLRAVLSASQVSALRGYGAGDTAFGLNVLSALCRAKPGTNVVVSPVSLATGLGMAYLGARGRTAAAMARVLHLPANGANTVAGLGDRSAMLNSLNRPGVTFTWSNRLWADPSLRTVRSFVAALRSGYQAGLTHLPLLARPEQARRAINASVAGDTHGHIPVLLPPGSIPPHAIGWVLTDALYLNATWKHGFDPASTSPGSFLTAAGKVTVDYMHGGSFAVAGGPGGWAGALLPYRGGRLGMVALLPPVTRPGARSSGGCQVPSAPGLTTLVHRLSADRGEGAPVALPKTTLASSESLAEVLKSLGLGVAFNQGAADFTGISPQACCIAFVQHAATMSVDEKGTVASAATATGVQASALVEPMIFNRPYLLMIVDSLTSEPLMLAWVANPANR